jgi:hypothetical protein
MSRLFNYLKTTKIKGWRAETAWQAAIAVDCLLVALALPFVLNKIMDYKAKHYPRIIQNEVTRGDLLQLVSSKRRSSLKTV